MLLEIYKTMLYPDAGGGTGTAGSRLHGFSIVVNNTATTDTTATGQPTAALMTTYLTKSNQGVPTSID